MALLGFGGVALFCLGLWVLCWRFGFAVGVVTWIIFGVRCVWISVLRCFGDCCYGLWLVGWFGCCFGVSLAISGC